MSRFVPMLGLLSLLACNIACGQATVHQIVSLEEGGKDGWGVFLGDEKFLIHRQGGDVERWSTKMLQREAVVLNTLEFAAGNLPEQPGESQMRADERLGWRAKAIHMAHHPESEYFLLYHYTGVDFNSTECYLYDSEFWRSMNRVEPERRWRVEGMVTSPAVLPAVKILLLPHRPSGTRTRIELQGLDASSLSESFVLGGHYKGHWWNEERGLVLASLTDQFASDYTISHYDQERNRIRKIGKWNLPEGLQILQATEAMGAAVIWNPMEKPTTNHNYYLGWIANGLRKLTEGTWGLPVSVRTTARLVAGRTTDSSKPESPYEFTLVDISSGEVVEKWTGYPREQPKVLSLSGRFLLSWCDNPQAEKNGWILRDFGR